jgi:hypothetical protein
VKNFHSQGWFSKVTLTRIVGSLFAITVFTPEINASVTVGISQNVDHCAVNIRGTQAVFNTSVEYIYLTEPANSGISKIPEPPQNVIPIFYISSGIHANNPYPGRYIYFSDKIPHKSFRQICLFMDIPPPVHC